MAQNQEGTRAPSVSLHHVSTQQEGGCLQARNRVLPRYESDGTLILDFAASRTVKKYVSAS